MLRDHVPRLHTVHARLHFTDHRGDRRLALGVKDAGKVLLRHPARLARLAVRLDILLKVTLVLLADHARPIVRAAPGEFVLAYLQRGSGLIQQHLRIIAEKRVHAGLVLALGALDQARCARGARQPCFLTHRPCSLIFAALWGAHVLTPAVLCGHGDEVPVVFRLVRLDHAAELAPRLVCELVAQVALPRENKPQLLALLKRLDKDVERCVAHVELVGQAHWAPSLPQHVEKHHAQALPARPALACAFLKYAARHAEPVVGHVRVQLKGGAWKVSASHVAQKELVPLLAHAVRPAVAVFLETQHVKAVHDADQDNGNPRRVLVASRSHLLLLGPRGGPRGGARGARGARRLALGGGGVFVLALRLSGRGRRGPHLVRLVQKHRLGNAHESPLPRHRDKALVPSRAVVARQRRVVVHDRRLLAHVKALRADGHVVRGQVVAHERRLELLHRAVHLPLGRLQDRLRVRARLLRACACRRVGHDGHFRDVDEVGIHPLRQRGRGQRGGRRVGGRGGRHGGRLARAHAETAKKKKGGGGGRHVWGVCLDVWRRRAGP